MSQCSKRIHEILSNAESKKLTDKKKCITELLELYENKDAIHEISKHTKDNTSMLICWPNILNVIHNLLVAEAERSAMKDTRPKLFSERRPTCLAVLKTVSNANSGTGIYLKCSDLIPLVLQILTQKRYNHYHDTYLTILTHHVLPRRTHRIEMSPEQWQELLKICIFLYENLSPNMSRRDLLSAIQLIVHYGCLYSHLVFKVKGILPFLKKVLSDVKSEQDELAKEAYKLAYTVCQCLGTESRFALCQFSEDILPIIISLNIPNEKYKLMHLLVRIHHPNGVTEQHEAAYACNWQKWKEILESMYLIILKDCKPEVMSYSFIHCACEVFKQILEYPSFSTDMQCLFDSYTSQPTKKRRIAVKIDKPLDMLNATEPKDVWAMVQILNVFIRKYPESLKLEDYVPFLKAITHLLSQCQSHQNEEIVDSLYELLLITLQIEGEFDNSELAEDTKEYWDKVGDILLRSLSGNLNETSGHKLMQHFIRNNKLMNSNALLRLYFTKTIRWSAHSLSTLLAFVNYIPLPDDMSMLSVNQQTYSQSSDLDSVRISLLKWILDVPWKAVSSKETINDFRKLLVFLISKSWCIRRPKSTGNNILADMVQDSTGLKNIETCYLSLTFHSNLFEKESETVCRKSNGKSMKVLLADDIVNFLKRHLNSIADVGDACKDAVSLATKITYIATGISVLREFDVALCDVQGSSLISTTENCLQSLCALIQTIEPKKSRFTYLDNLTKALTVLYGTHYHEEVANVIISSSTKQMLRSVFNQLNVEDKDTTDGPRTIRRFNNIFQGGRRQSDIEESDNSPGNDGIIRTQAIVALVSFCRMRTGQEKLQVQINLMKNLLTFGMYDITCLVDFRMAMTVLESLTGDEAEENFRLYDNALLEFFLELFKCCYKDEECIRSVLKILPHFFVHIANHIEPRERLVSYFFVFYKRLYKGRYGPQVYVEFIKCLPKIAEVDPAGSWANWTIEENTAPLIETVLHHVTNPFYVVRLQTARCIQQIFSLKCIEFCWKALLFNKLIEAVTNSFIVDRTLEKYEERDEQQCRTASALLMVISVLLSSETLQNEALFALLQMTVDNTVKNKFTKKGLSAATKEMNYPNIIENNLNYLAYNWLLSGKKINTFPWDVTDSISQFQFYNDHIKTLVLSHMQVLNFTDAKALCENVETSFEEVVEQIFPQLLSWLLSVACQSNDSEEDQSAVIGLGELVSNKGIFKSVRSVSNLLNEKFGDIVVSIVQRLHDEEDFVHTFGQRVPLPILDPLSYPRQTIDKCLRYFLEQLCGVTESLPQILALKRPSFLQRILMDLTSNIYSMKFSEHKCKAFHQYVYFSTLIIENLSNEYFNAIAMYLIREISYTLLHLIKEDNDLLSRFACRHFYVFLKAVLPSRDGEIKEILDFCVTTLIPIAQSGKVPMASKILHFLIVSHKDTLSEAIKKLPPFPKDEAFEEIRNVHNSLKYRNNMVYTLEEEIEHFLKTSSWQNANFSADGLVHLREQLSSRREELKFIYEGLESLRGFAEDCAQSIPHKLTYTLIKLTRSSNPNVSIEAAKCLGELGPADLTTMILYPTESHTKDEVNCVDILVHEILKLLIEFLNHADIKLRKASAESLYVVLSSYWGQKLLNPSYLSNLEVAIRSTENPLRLDYIRPFILKAKTASKKVQIDGPSFELYVKGENEIWTTKSYGSYSEWIIEITKNIASCFSGIFLKDLTRVFSLSSEFCEPILPRMMYLLIHVDQRSSNYVCRCINRFFDYHFNPSNRTDTELSRCSRETVHCMLNVVNFMRIQAAGDVELPLDYMYIAKAAQYCSAFFTAILYTELCCKALLETERFTSDFNNITKIDYLCEHKPREGRELQSILRDVYLKIGDPDAIYGCGFSHLRDNSSRVQHYIHTRKWDKVILAQDVELCFGNSSARSAMVNALQQSGLQYLLGQFVFNASNGDKLSDDYQYESAWRLCNWDICRSQSVLEFQESTLSDDTAVVKDSDYYFYHYQALKCFHDGHEDGIKDAIENARLSVGKALANVSLESSKTVYEKLVQLRMLREIEEICLSKPTEYVNILEDWSRQNIGRSNEFQYVEPILTQRTVIYRSKDSLFHNSEFKTALANTYLYIADIAEKQGYLQTAALALDTLAKLPDLSSEIRDQLRYQEALLMWIRNDQDIARFLLRSLMNEKSLNLRLRADVLRVYGNWMAEMKSENSQAIIKNYYLESINSAEMIRDKVSWEEKMMVEKGLHNSHVALARFADAQFELITAYMKSPQFEGLKESVNYSNTVKLDTAQKDRDLRRAMICSRRQMSNDVAELANTEKEKNYYLITALTYYLKVLQQSEDYNLLIFRLIALWLDNRSFQEVNSLLEENLDGIASFKFIPLIPQLAAHMSNVLDEFSSKIYGILKRCAVEHPHHTLPVLLALKNLYIDMDYTRSKQASDRQEEPRVLGARKLLMNLNSSDVANIIKEMDILSHSLVMLAYSEGSQAKVANVYKISRDQKILKIKDFRNLLMPTLTTAVRPNGNYVDIVGVHKYLDTFENVGGINAPKKITCVGTNGICYKQLVKGKDDLRQDAVMQQVFNVMNILLKTCKETNKRKLKIRTYKVVPLSQRSGVLEWCDNTIPMLAALVGTKTQPGVHTKYYPNDYTADQCKKLIGEVEKESNEKRLKVFLDCCAHMHPAFHHFFMDKYPSPETWYERRLTYTRSVATTSMAGYILGLGDRHLSNILLDQSTAELVHIDFGYAFEEGKVLPVPETVPFRLTRDIEVAMGVSGVEGTMRRSCEQTLTVMRDQRQIIITLLQVLLYDPLFSWSITPAKAHNLQGGGANWTTDNNQDEIKTNRTAERALLRIEQKLQGTEEGLPSSVAGQVEKLIQEARDPSNLSRIFFGWQAYL